MADQAMTIERQLFENCFNALYRPSCIYALHYLQDVDAAEDIVSSCFERFWDKLSEGEAISSPKQYIYASIRNACIDFLRKGDTLPVPLPRDCEGPITDEEAADRSEIEARLWSAVDKLPKRRRQILLMSKRDNLSYKEIALRLNISENTVRNSIEAALKSLRGQYSDIFGILSLLF